MSNITSNIIRFWVIMMACVVLLIILKRITPKIIGWFGEHWTKKALKKLPKDKYIVINDVLISLNNITHQIDHIVVSPYGIFVIETKQYNGYITGSKYDKKWVRHIGRIKKYYTNPIRQNYGHVKTLSQLLSVDEKYIYNIVCIPSKAKLKIQHDGELVYHYSLVDKIKSYKELVIPNVEDIVNKINISNITDKYAKKEHINYIRDNIIDDDTNKCPKCGGQLVQRNGKYGIFMGCSNFPKCKYTKNI